MGRRRLQPCSVPAVKGRLQSMGSLPRVASSSSRVSRGDRRVRIVVDRRLRRDLAGFQLSEPARRAIAPDIRRPTSPSSMLARLRDAPEMMKRLQTAVIDMHPDLVIWRSARRGAARPRSGRDGETWRRRHHRIQAAGADVVLMIRNIRRGSTSMRKRRQDDDAVNKVAELRKVGIFPRFAGMKDWHEKQEIPIEIFVIADGLHMSDWATPLRATARRRHHQVGRPDQARRQRALGRAAL